MVVSLPTTPHCVQFLYNGWKCWCSFLASLSVKLHPMSIYSEYSVSFRYNYYLNLQEIFKFSVWWHLLDISQGTLSVARLEVMLFLLFKRIIWGRSSPDFQRSSVPAHIYVFKKMGSAVQYAPHCALEESWWSGVRFVKALESSSSFVYWCQPTSPFPCLKNAQAFTMAEWFTNLHNVTLAMLPYRKNRFELSVMPLIKLVTQSHRLTV